MKKKNGECREGKIKTFRSGAYRGLNSTTKGTSLNPDAAVAVDAFVCHILTRRGAKSCDHTPNCPNSRTQSLRGRPGSVWVGTQVNRIASTKWGRVRMGLEGVLAHLMTSLRGPQLNSEKRIHCQAWSTSPTWNGCWDARWLDRKSTRLNSSHSGESRMPSSA